MQRICSVLLIGCVVVLIVCSVLKTRALFWKSCLSNPKNCNIVKIYCMPLVHDFFVRVLNCICKMYVPVEYLF